MWRQENKAKERMRQKRHSIAWQEVSEVEKKKIKGVVHKLSHRWGLGHWVEDIYQEVFLARLQWEPTDTQTTFPIDRKTIDGIRRIFGRTNIVNKGGVNKKNSKRIPEHSLTFEPIETIDSFFGVQEEIDPISFVDQAVHIIRVHFKRIKGHSVKAAVFELIMKHGFNQEDVASLFCVTPTAIHFIHKECMKVLNEKLANTL